MGGDYWVSSRMASSDIWADYAFDEAAGAYIFTQQYCEGRPWRGARELTAERSRR